MDKESRRKAFRENIKGMTTEQLRKLTDVLRRSTDDVIEELTVLQEQLEGREPHPSLAGQRTARSRRARA